MTYEGIDASQFEPWKAQTSRPEPVDREKFIEMLDLAIAKAMEESYLSVWLARNAEFDLGRIEIAGLEEPEDE